MRRRRALLSPHENRIVGDSMATMLFLMHVRRSSKMAKVFPASGKRLLGANTKGESRKAYSCSIWIIRGARERRFEGELSWPARLRQSARLPPPSCHSLHLLVSLLLDIGGARAARRASWLRYKQSFADPSSTVLLGSARIRWALLWLPSAAARGPREV